MELADDPAQAAWVLLAREYARALDSAGNDASMRLWRDYMTVTRRLYRADEKRDERRPVLEPEIALETPGNDRLPPVTALERIRARKREQMGDL